jgi:predicted unusual protein kinase regulating ubiquinone biosynthesis (AarF/ABC1/UbiB family)
VRRHDSPYEGASSDNGGVTDLPRKAVTRTVKLAALPLGFAGRTALGFGKRVGGRPAELVAAEIQTRTAEQLFRVLGELKGGAMKFGQAMSIFEAALPEELAAPYRATLTKLQDAAPPMPAATVHKVLAASLGRQWRRKFTSFEDRPTASASIGQVHKAVWSDGRTVAVKVQYPGAGPALISDLDQISRLGRLFGVIVPGMDMKPLLAELRARVVEELDYRLEAESQHAFAAAYADDDDFVVPDVVAQAETVLVTEWIEGEPLSRVIVDGATAHRDDLGTKYLRFLFSGPARAGLLHADPHPGNYRVMADGRLGVVDYGAVAHLPDGLPPSIGRLLRRALDGDAQTVLEGLREEGFVRQGSKLDAQVLVDYLSPFIEPAEVERFRFDRDWMRGQFTRINDPRQENWSVGLKLNLPPDYLLVHRVWLGGLGVLCQLGAEVPMRSELERWLPGFAPDPG